MVRIHLPQDNKPMLRLAVPNSKAYPSTGLHYDRIVSRSNNSFRLGKWKADKKCYLRATPNSLAEHLHSVVANFECHARVSSAPPLPSPKLCQCPT